MSSLDELSPGAGSRAGDPLSAVSSDLRKPCIEWREWVWVAGVACLVLILASLPYWTAYVSQTRVEIFSGAVFDRQDFAVHMATMHLGERGDWAYQLRFTSEPQKGVYTKLAYIFLGHLARFLGLSVEIVYHLARISFGLFAMALIYLLSAWYFPEIFWRRVAFSLVVIGSGLGWLQIILNWIPQADLSPIDFWLTDGYFFFGLLAFPHFTAVAALLCGMLVSSFSFWQRPSLWKWIVAAACAMLIQAIQPYAPVLADLAITGAYFTAWLTAGASSGRFLRKGALFISGLALIQAPLFLYNLFAFAYDPLLKVFASQNVTLSPPPLYYVWGYGLLWLPALLSGVSILRSRKEPIRHPASDQPIIMSQYQAEAAPNTSLPLLTAAFFWVAGALLLAYFPFNLQRRFMFVFVLPLALLATAGFRDVVSPFLAHNVPGWLRSRLKVFGLFYVFFAALSSIYLSFGLSLYLSQRPAGLFDPVGLVDGIFWLGSHSGQDEVILSSEVTGQLIAATIGRPVYFGHPIETLDYNQKAKNVKSVYSGDYALNWLRQAGVRWVVAGPREYELGPGPAPSEFLQVAYQNSDMTIYRVVP